MKKPGAIFGFQPKNNLASSDTPEFCKSPTKKEKIKAVDHGQHGGKRSPLQPPKQHNYYHTSTPPSPTTMDDDDLRFIESRVLGVSQSPLQPIQPNQDPIVISSSPAEAAKQNRMGGGPVFGRPTPMQSQIYRREKGNPLLQPPRNRPEWHRPYKMPVPTGMKYEDVEAAPQQMYSSMDSGAHPAKATQSSYADHEFYTDPAKASSDLKALLEGNLDEDEEEKPEAKADDDDEDDDNAGKVEGIKVRLLPHQVEGVEWMRGRELGPVKKGARVPKGGILADDMGLGKTLQSISLIMSNPMPIKDEKGWKKNFEGVEKATLVVAPLALIRQWEAEIKEKVESQHALRVYVHHGPQRTKEARELSRYDVVVTTYQILVSEHGDGSATGPKGACFGLHWYRVILDEAHSIKNRNAKASKACCALRSEYRWCLTGTPMQNNLDELQSLVKFLRIAPYDDLARWKEHIDQPMKNGKGHIAIRRLHGLLRCFMKRRRKDILKEEGALNPGGKKTAPGEESSTGFRVTERKVVTVSAVFSKAELEFYKKLEAQADRSLENMMKQKVNYANALVLLLRLRQACNHPKLAENKLEKDKDALSAETQQQKKKSDDLDDLADMFGGMGIKAKKCEVCQNPLSREEMDEANDQCRDCRANFAEFNGEASEKKKKKKRSKVKKTVKEKVEVEVEVEVEVKKKAMKNRRVITDSDDEVDSEEEEADGSWLVGEDQRGSLRLGKAGGQEDEDAEGGGEDLGKDDSLHDSEDDESGSDLDSFVVDDESSKADISRTEEDSEDNDTFESVSAIAKQVEGMTLSQQSAAFGSESETEVEDEDDSGVSESEIESDSDAENSMFHAHSKRGHVRSSAKIAELINILRKEVEEHKFIVFSQFTSMLDLVEPFFRKEGFKFTRYDGSMKNDEREASLGRLRNDKGCRILLCSLKCGSLGLNLTAATRVVILEPFWNPFVEEQAIDRVHRLTQTVDVVIYKITIKDSVEERILALQERKRLLAEQAIEGGMKKNALKLGLDELMNLFRHDGRGEYEPQNSQYSDAQTAGDSGRVLNGAREKKRASTKRPEDPIWGRR